MTTLDETILFTTTESPIGELILIGGADALREIHIRGGRKPASVAGAWTEAAEPFESAREQLAEYFAGERTSSTSGSRRAAPSSSAGCGVDLPRSPTARR